MLNELITEFLEHLEIEKGRSPLTVRNYDQYLRAFVRWLGGGDASTVQVADITLASVRKFRIHLSRQKNNRGEFFKHSTQNYYLIALRSFLKFLQKSDIACLAPEKIELARQQRPQVSVLDVDKLLIMLKAAFPHDPNDLAQLRDYAILETLFATGLRVAELVGLNRDRINTSTREFVVRGKGSKDRVVFLSQRAAHALENYFKKRSDSFVPVFLNHRHRAEPSDKRGEGLRLTPRSMERIVQKYARRAGLVEKITPHTLRHTFATDLLMNGADLRSVQELLGHSNIATTQVYTHITNRQLREVHEAFHGKRLKR
jgi:site-specific recombinase XerD